MKKQLKMSDEDKKLIAINTYLNLFLGDLEEVVNKEAGNIYLRESGDEYAKVWIQKKYSKCWVEYSFWKEFSELFSLEDRDVQSFIARWVEDTYQLKGINTTQADWLPQASFKIPTN